MGYDAVKVQLAVDVASIAFFIVAGQLDCECEAGSTQLQKSKFSENCSCVTPVILVRIKVYHYFAIDKLFSRRLLSAFTSDFTS